MIKKEYKMDNRCKYTVKHNKIIIRVDMSVYSKKSVIRAAYEFIDKCYVYIDIDKTDYLIELEIKAGKDAISEVIAGEFWNEMLIQQMRIDISRETKNIRELILTRALYSSYMETDDGGDSSYETEHGKYSLEDITKDWFENEAYFKAD